LKGEVLKQISQVFLPAVIWLISPIDKQLPLLALAVRQPWMLSGFLLVTKRIKLDLEDKGRENGHK